MFLYTKTPIGKELRESQISDQRKSDPLKEDNKKPLQEET